MVPQISTVRAIRLKAKMKQQLGEVRGAQGRDRTTDTAIFSRMLYQLSYLGTSQGRKARLGSAGL